MNELPLPTPLGTLLVVLDEAGRLHAARFADTSPARSPVLPRPAAELRVLLAAYFDGAVDALRDWPVTPAGTPFQQQVWRALREIPAGETLSYAALAQRLGLADHHAARAVGAANAANPVALVIPCHRVIAADGRPLGYAWGVERKRWLLRHESEHAAAAAQGRLL